MKWLGLTLSIVIVGMMALEYIQYEPLQAAINRVVLEVYLEM